MHAFTSSTSPYCKRGDGSEGLNFTHRDRGKDHDDELQGQGQKLFQNETNVLSEARC